MPRLQRSNPKTKYHAIGNYITDFCPTEARLVIELDGSQHLEQEGYDQERTEYLAKQGYIVVRFWNNDVFVFLEFPW